MYDFRHLLFIAEYVIPLLPMFALVLVSEIVVDWIKHAFITKFNDISPDVYRRYRAILSKDLATSHHGNVSDVYNMNRSQESFVCVHYPG